MLDKAKNVEEAVTLIRKHNIRFNGGPQIHYLIADATGKSVVVEIKNKKMNVIRNDRKWNSATNFHLVGNEGREARQCRRYAQIQTRMKQKDGKLTIDEAFKLLKNVSQASTRWSVVYDMKQQTANIAMSRNFKKVMKYKVRKLEKSSKVSK